MNIKQKLSSRKLWASIVGLIVGLATIFGLDEGIINTVAGSIIAASSVMTYIITEGVVDAKAIGKLNQENESNDTSK